MARTRTWAEKGLALKEGHERKPFIAFSRPTISGFAIPMSPNQVRQVTMSFPPHAVICNGNTPDLPFWPLAYAYPCRSDIASQCFPARAWLIYTHMPCSPARFRVIVPKDIYWVATSPASCRIELPVTMAREDLTLLCRCLAVIHKYVHVASSAEAGR